MSPSTGISPEPGSCVIWGAMSRTVQCSKLGKELPGLDFVPMKGELGQRIYEEISQEAWGLWLKHSTLVINERRLNPSEPEARKVLYEQLEQFLFGGGAEMPEGYVPPTSEAP